MRVDVAAQGRGAAGRQQHDAVVGADLEGLVEIGQPFGLTLSFEKAEVGQVDVSFAQQRTERQPAVQMPQRGVEQSAVLADRPVEPVVEFVEPRRSDRARPWPLR